MQLPRKRKYCRDTLLGFTCVVTFPRELRPLQHKLDFIVRFGSTLSCHRSFLETKQAVSKSQAALWTHLNLTRDPCRSLQLFR